MSSNNPSTTRNLPRDLAFIALGVFLVVAGIMIGGGMNRFRNTGLTSSYSKVVRDIPRSDSHSESDSKISVEGIEALASLVKNYAPRNGSVIIAGKNKLELKWDDQYHIYRIRGKPIIWVFWNEEEIPTLIKASLGSIACFNRKNFHMQVVHESDIHLWVDHVHPAFTHLIPAHKADYFRGRILDAYGGAYLDADTLGFANMWHLFHKLLWYDVVNMSWPPDGDAISITNMGPVRAQTEFTAKWVTDLHVLLDKKLGDLEKKDGNYPIQWAEILRGIVVPLVHKLLKESTSFSFFAMTGQKTFGQFVSSGNDPAKKLSTIKNGPLTFHKYELLIYHNSGIPDDVRKMPLGELLNSDIIIAELIRTSFRVCQAERTSKIRNNELTKPVEIKIQSSINTEGIESLKSFITQFLEQQTYL